MQAKKSDRKRYEIEETVRRAFHAGQDMLLICSKSDLIRRGYDSLLAAARSGEILSDRIAASLSRIAELKSLFKELRSLDKDRYSELAQDVTRLNSKLNYTYGGKI